MLPNFLVIGAEKSGTTWLKHNLREHPSIFIPSEIHLEELSGLDFTRWLTE